MIDELLKLKIDLLERKCDVFDVLLTDILCEGNELASDRIYDSLNKANDVLVKCDVNVDKINDILYSITGGSNDGR